LQSLEPVVDEERARKVFYEERRQGKIANVLFAIRFGREVMHMPQAQLDQRLAELMVVGGYDRALDRLQPE
jgi:hypothetical protein